MDNASIEDLKKMIDNLNKTILNLANQLEEERKKNQPPAADSIHKREQIRHPWYGYYNYDRRKRSRTPQTKSIDSNRNRYKKT